MGEPLYGLIGQNLTHSYSVPIHRALGNEAYALYPLEPEVLGSFLGRADVRGLNVTIPYKRAVIPYCDRLDETAASIGSVNTLVRDGAGKLAGYNTDAAGFLWMAERAGISLACRKALVLGSGGASLTVQAVLRARGAGEVVVVSRSGPENYLNLSQHRDADLLINATPVGMYPHPGTAPVTLDDFPRLSGVLDLIYNPWKTALLLRAEALGIPFSDGLPMLVAQAKAAEELFTGQPMDDRANTRILGLMRRNALNIVLIGMPGSGKSTVGMLLAQLAGREAIDLDKAVERAAGRSIPEIFAASGEDAFRAMETAQAKQYGMESGKVLITGGGIVTRAENRPLLRQNGRVYHVLRDVNKLARSGRPLSLNGNLDAMEARRMPLYEAFRDATVENNAGAADAARLIWRDFCAYTGA